MTAPSMNSLKGKTALITGASSGVGRALALELAALGAVVLLVGRSPQKLNAVAAEIRENAGQAHAFEVDLTKDPSLSRFASDVKQHFSRLDFLVHSAGVFRAAPIASASIADLDEIFRVNVRAPFALTQALLPQLLEARGCVVFVNSTVSPGPNVSQYAASKFALKALADTLRAECSGQGLRVLSVMLGRTATPMQEEVCRLEGSVYEASRFLAPEHVAHAVASALSLPTNAELSELTIRPART